LLVLAIIVTMTLPAFATVKVKATDFYTLKIPSSTTMNPAQPMPQLFADADFNITYTDPLGVLHVNETGKTTVTPDLVTFFCAPGTYATITWVKDQVLSLSDSYLHVFDHFYPADNVVGETGDTKYITLYYATWCYVGFAAWIPGSGTVTPDPSPLSDNLYAQGVYYNVDATATPGYRFSNYFGDDPTKIDFVSYITAKTQFEPKGNVEVYADFEPWPYANFTESAHTVPVGTTINFDASKSKPSASPPSGYPYYTIKSFNWNWGDGTSDYSSTSPTANHAYAAPGTYTVTLTVTDSTGHQATVNDTKVVRDPRQLKMDAVSELKTARPLATKSNTVWEMDGAVYDIQMSLTPSYWMDDSHVNGLPVFYWERYAIVRLTAILASKIESTGFMNTIQAVIGKLLRADDGLAGTAIKDAKNLGSTKPAVMLEITLADQAYYKATHPSGAVYALDQFELAWYYAETAIGLAK
jgi:PKD repeat protein